MIKSRSVPAGKMYPLSNTPVQAFGITKENRENLALNRPKWKFRVQEGFKDYIAKEAILDVMKTRDLKEIVQNKTGETTGYTKLSIVLHVARTAYQDLDFTATREDVINFDIIINTSYFNCRYYNFNPVYFGTFTIDSIDRR